MHVDQARMEQVIHQAFEKVSDDPRWEAAIARAKREFESNPYMHWDGRTLLVLSDSNEIYVVDDRGCQCQSFQWKKPCWHRAAARLLRRYDEFYQGLQPEAMQIVMRRLQQHAPTWAELSRR